MNSQSLPPSLISDGLQNRSKFFKSYTLSGPWSESLLFRFQISSLFPWPSLAPIDLDSDRSSISLDPHSSPPLADSVSHSCQSHKTPAEGLESRGGQQETSWRPAKAKTSRFGRKQDKGNDEVAEVFDLLKKYCKETGREISEFWTNSYPLSKDLKSILKRVYEASLWKGSLKELYKRIAKLGQSTFSVRERKLLKKLSKEQLKNGKIDYEILSYHLPGKTIEAIKAKLVKIK